MSEQLLTIGVFKFVRRPVTTLPADGTLCFVDQGTERGWNKQPTVAVYKDGEWQTDRGAPLNFEPLFWTDLAGVRDART